MVGFRRVRFATLGLVAGAVLMAAAVPAGAAGSKPGVVLGSSTSAVEYTLRGAPHEPVTDTSTRSGNRSSVQRANEVSTDNGEAKATVRQATTTNHGPTPAGYTVRTIRSVGDASGLVDLTNDTDGGPMEASAVATSVTQFTVNSPTWYAIGNGYSAQADSKACSKSIVILRGAAGVLFRKTVTSGTCLPGAPANIVNGTGELQRGTYTLETVAAASALDDELYGEPYAPTMKAKVTATLTLGSGKVCNNVLSNAGKTIVGTAGNDVLCGGSGVDTIKGHGGNDLILGMGSGDTISGGGGADVIQPGGGADTVAAGGGGDIVTACDGVKDRLSGGAGRDQVQRDRADVLSSFETKTRC